MGSQKEEWVSFDSELEKQKREAAGGSDVDGDPLKDLNDIPLYEEKPPMPAGKATAVATNGVAEIGITSHEETKGSRKGSAESSKTASTIEADETKVLRNAKIIASISPINEHMAWIVPPVYDTSKQNQAIANVGLPNNIYSQIMRQITDDLRFKTYMIAFSRALPMWIIFSIVVLLFLLITSPEGGFYVMVMTFFWMLMLFIGIFFCIIIRKHLRIGLSECVGEANKHLLHYNMIVGVQDRGQLSCHKVVIIFMYYETKECLLDIEKMLRIANSTAKPKPILMTHDEMGSRCDQLLRGHIQPYIKSFVKHRLLFPTRPAEGVSDFRPKHCKKNHCLCQYVEEEYFNAIKKTWSTKSGKLLNVALEVAAVQLVQIIRGFHKLEI